MQKKKNPTHMYNVHSTLQYKVNESLRKKTMIKHFTVKKDDKIQWVGEKGKKCSSYSMNGEICYMWSIYSLRCVHVCPILAISICLLLQKPKEVVSTFIDHFHSLHCCPRLPVQLPRKDKQKLHSHKVYILNKVSCYLKFTWSAILLNLDNNLTYKTRFFSILMLPSNIK